MKSGKSWIFTPNKREFIKIFSSLNKKSFDFCVIDSFLDKLEVTINKMKNEIYVNDTVEYECGGDGKGDGVFSNENLSDKKKSFAKLTNTIKDFSKGVLGHETIKIHPIGKLVNVKLKFEIIS